MKKFLCIAIIVFSFLQNSTAQSVAINTSGATANASSILDVQSTTKGMLIPRMTKAQKNAIASPATGLLIYQGAPDSTGFYYYSGSQWIWLNSFGGNDWKLTGNAGTDTAVNFLGTTDNMPLAFRVNNEKSGRIESDFTANTFLGNRSGLANTTGFNNTAFGFRALSDNTSGSSNVAIGSYALENSIGFRNYNIAIGDNALQNNAGTYNIGIGYQSVLNSSGNANTGIGTWALRNNTSGQSNIGIGYYSLLDNTTGRTNIGIGLHTLSNNTAGSYNIAIGDSAAYNNNASRLLAIGNWAAYSNTTGIGITAIGDSTLYANTTGSVNTGLGASALVKNTTGSNNLGIGKQALNNNSTGFQNIAIGNQSLFNNTIGQRNIAIGTVAAYNNQASKNIAIGDFALYLNTTGDNLTAIGSSALQNNSTGHKNIALGNDALTTNTTGYQNVAIGYAALEKNTLGFANIAIGDSALSANTTADWNLAVGRYALYETTTGDKNIAIGESALQNNSIGAANVAIGYASQISASTGNNNTSLGFQSLYGNQLGYSNTAIGGKAMGKVATSYSVNNNVAVGDSTLYSVQTGANSNTAIGSKTLYSNITGANNTALGFEAGYSSLGSGNVFMGYEAGRSETGSNKLYIDNSSTSSPLIFGDFAANLVRINSTLNINNEYTFPTLDGTANQVLQTNGAGNVSWATVSGESTTANNGLTLTGSNVALGGSLLNNTTLTHANFNLTHSLSGTGDFLITTPSNNALSVLSTGNTGINTNTPTHRLHLVNTVSGVANNYTNGIFIQNTNATAGQATLAFKNTVLPGNRAWITGMNAFDNYVIAYGDSLVGTTTIVRVDTAGFVGINPTGLPSSRLDVVGSFGNAIRTTTVNTTLGVDDHTIIIGTAAGAITVTLPAANTCERRVYIIVNRSASNQTTTSYLDFSGSSTTIAANSAITLQSNGTNWFRVQ